MLFRKRVFGNYWKLGQTENVFYVDCKIRAHECKMFSSFIFTSNELHFSHNTLSELLSHALLTDHWYSPSSLTPSSTLSLMPNAANPLPRASPSSTHNPTSAKDPPTVSFLFQLSSFLSSTTSPHLWPTLYKSRSTSPQTHLAKIHPQTHKQPINVFLLIFGCVKVYILKFYVIKFVWKLRKWLRKCEKFVGK